MEHLCNSKSMNILNHLYQSFKAVSDKDLMPTLPFSDGRKQKKIRGSKRVFAAVLTDFSKAFDCIPRGLLITKLNAFGSDE